MIAISLVLLATLTTTQPPRPRPRVRQAPPPHVTVAHPNHVVVHTAPPRPVFHPFVAAQRPRVSAGTATLGGPVTIRSRKR